MKRATRVETPYAPTPPQLNALSEYAAWAGEEWKTRLRADWMRSGSLWRSETSGWGYLQQLRNERGFDLEGYEL